jgi:hypothetical protein
MAMYQDLKGRFKTLLHQHSGKIHATMDIWSSPKRSGFLGITIMWLDEEWGLRDFLLSFQPFDGKWF